MKVLSEKRKVKKVENYQKYYLLKTQLKNVITPKNYVHCTQFKMFITFSENLLRYVKVY